MEFRWCRSDSGLMRIQFKRKERFAVSSFKHMSLEADTDEGVWKKLSLPGEALPGARDPEVQRALGFSELQGGVTAC